MFELANSIGYIIKYTNAKYVPVFDQRTVVSVINFIRKFYQKRKLHQNVRQKSS